MHIDLNQGFIANAAEAVDFSGLDHEDVARAGLELLPVHGPETAPLSYELHFIVGVTVRSGPASRQGPQEEHRHIDIAIVRADELVRAALKREILLANPVHPSGNPMAARSA